MLHLHPTQRRTTSRRLALLSTMAIVGSLLLAAAPTFATNGDPHKVTICHRTNSVTNPYVVITVDYSGADGGLVHDNGNGDHTGHMGLVFDAANPPSPPHNGDQWGDIIPPFTWEGDANHSAGSYPGMNWTAEGQAIYNNGCAPEGGESDETPTPSPSPSSGGSPDTEISKSASVTAIDAGGSLVYTLTIINDDADLATDVLVRDDLNNSLIINSVVTSQGTCSIGAGNLVSCELGDMAGFATATVTINVTVTDENCPELRNSANVRASNELNPDGSQEVSSSNRVTIPVTCATSTPTPTPTPVTETPTPSPTPVTETPSPSPTPVTETPSPTPEGSQAGSTGTPAPITTPEGNVAGATGTPGGSLPNTAAGSPVSSPFLALVFAMVLLGSIGTLAVVNLDVRRHS